jgi:hypothetical protein
MQLVDESRYASSFGTRNPEYRIVVLAHKPIGRGMVRTIIKEVDLSVSEFNGLI